MKPGFFGSRVFYLSVLLPEGNSLLKPAITCEPFSNADTVVNTCVFQAAAWDTVFFKS